MLCFFKGFTEYLPQPSPLDGVVAERVTGLGILGSGT